MDELFESSDPFSNVEEVVDAYGHKFSERWNVLPESGGRLIAKGNAKYSHDKLERFTGTTPIPKKNSEIHAPEPMREYDIETKRRSNDYQTVKEELSKTKSGLQGISQTDALELGRDPSFYNGYNIVHKGLFRNNGKEQLRETSFSERMGAREMDSVQMPVGKPLPPRKAGDVDRLSHISQAKEGLKGEAAVKGYVSMSGLDATRRLSPAKVMENNATVSSDVPIGTSDSVNAVDARRINVEVPHEVRQGNIPISIRDSREKKLTRRDIYAECSSIEPSKSVSKWDSVLGQTGAREYLRQSSIRGRHSLSENDSEVTHREGQVSYIQEHASHGRIPDARKDDALPRDIDAQKRDFSALSQSVGGKLPHARRLGPQTNHDANSKTLHHGERFQASQGEITRDRKGLETKANMMPANLEGERAIDSDFVTSVNETRRVREEAFTKRNVFTDFVQGVRSAIQSIQNEKKSFNTRVESRQLVQQAASGGLSTRKTPDDSVMKRHGLPKIGAFVRAGLGVEERSQKDRTQGTLLNASNLQNNLMLPTISEPKTSRGLHMVDDSNMKRSTRVL